MKVTASLFFFLFFSLALTAQQHFYWIKFKDKSNSPYSLSNPLQFLSQKSLDRRFNQGLQLDSTDLPISPAYQDSILPYINSIYHRIKWRNEMVVEIDSAYNVDSIRRFSFVDSINSIEYLPLKDLQVNNKIESVTPVDQNIVYPNPYGAAYNQIRMLNADLLHQLGYRGQGIIISMMDNGLSGADTIHAFDSVRARILFTWNFVFHQRSVYNDGGHGTNTFSCIAANEPGKFIGTAPDASFLLFQSEQNDAEWVMEEYNWAEAAETADSIGAQIFSTSLGYSIFQFLGTNVNDTTSSHSYADLSGDKTVITHAANQAYGKGILVLNSAGNEGQNSWHYIIAPADGDSVLTVGAVDSTETIAPFSSYGPNAANVIKPDVCAQGSRSSVINTSGVPALSSGTSFSCPILAGCAASLWSAFPNKTAREIKEAIIISANRFWTPDNSYGYGIPNFYTAYLLLKTNYNTNELEPDRQPAVFPNPFSNELYLSLYSAQNQNHLIEIFNLLGQLVYTKQFFVRQQTYEITQLDNVDGLAEGEYVIRLDHGLPFSATILKIK